MFILLLIPYCLAVKVVVDGKRYTLDSVYSNKEFGSALKKYVKSPEDAIIYYKDKLYDLGSDDEGEFRDSDHFYVFSRNSKESSSLYDIFNSIYQAYLKNRFDAGRSGEFFKNSKEDFKANFSDERFSELLKNLASSPLFRDTIKKYITPDNVALLNNILNKSKINTKKISSNATESKTPEEL